MNRQPLERDLMTASEPTASVVPPRGLAAPVALGLFTASYVILNSDRSILSVVTELVKHEYHLSDSAMGFLNGAGFAIFFALAGFPLGRWVDRGVRRNILVGCLAIFSLMTGATALTRTFLQLLVTRIGVAVGEAGGSPAMLSMISDLYPPRWRASAMGVYYLGVPLGLFMTFWLGSYIAANFGWRAAFLVGSVPGFALALLTVIFVREPIRARFDAVREAAAPPFLAALGEIFGRRALRHVLIATVLTSTVSAGLIPWLVSVLIRTHGFTLIHAGALSAIAFGGAGAIGTALSGWLVDLLARRDPRWRAWYCSVVLLIAMPLFIAFLLAKGAMAVALLLIVWALFNSAIYGPVIAMCQSLVGSRLRGVVSAIYMFAGNVIGVSFGTQIIGMGSDLLKPLVGQASLRDAMLLLTSFYIWAALHFFIAARTLTADLAHIAQDTGSAPAGS
jgi:predicted MFS family arabinose efflux permease